jgi:hypothetical protein
MIAGITPRGHLQYPVYRRRVSSPQVIRFLRYLLGHIRGRIVVFWDGGSIHTSKIVQRFLDGHRGRPTAHFFPDHPPDVNPQEVVWTQVGESLSVSVGSFGSSSVEELYPEHADTLSVHKLPRVCEKSPRLTSRAFSTDAIRTPSLSSRTLY